MNSSLLSPARVLVAAGLLVGAHWVEPIQASDSITADSGSLSLPIPDGSPTGIQHTMKIANVPPGSLIRDVTLTLNISGGMTGDLFGYVVHDTGYAVLLNRPGRTASSGLGYDDLHGLSVSFRDDAPADIHSYRSNPTVPLGGPLTGSWQPDGRATPVAAAWDTDARTAMLNSFQGLAPSGDWTLFLYDASPVDQATLTGWSLSLGTAIVPEPDAVVMAMVGGVVVVLFRRRARG